MKISRYSSCITLILTISLVMIISGGTDALGYGEGLSISANAVEGSDTIEITGQTSSANYDITFTVMAPNYNLVSVDQISPRSNGYFATVISVGGPLWSQDGTYIVTAQQGNNYMFTDSVNIRIADGVLGKQFDKKVTTYEYWNDCTATNVKWDKKIERGEDFTITWSNPDTNNCRYDVLFYHADKSRTGEENISEYNIANISWDSIGIKYFKICPTNDNDCKSNSEYQSFELINTSVDCTASNIKWDKKIERGEDFTITWKNPDTNNCRYDVLFYNNDKSDGGMWPNKIDSTTNFWDGIGTKFFKICPTNDNDCKSPFYSFTLEDTSGNIVFIIVGLVVVAGISIILVSKKNKNKKSQTSTTVPSQKESITEIDKQIAINEEKIRKMEEESKKLDEEN